MIGGSLGQALRRTRRYRILGIARKSRTLRDAKRVGAIDTGSTRLLDAARADIIVIATPVNAVIPTLKKILPLLRPGTIVTDVASVKGAILSGVARLRWPKGIHFMGAHPLVGSHRTGVKAASANLFFKSTCVLVPHGNAPVNEIAALWRACGARVQVMSAASHDAAVALISHLPHVLAHALVHTIASHRARRTLAALVAGSFRDATRVASADAEQWTQILQANATEVRRALRLFGKNLSRLGRTVNSSRLGPELKKSQTFRRALFNDK